MTINVQHNRDGAGDMVRRFDSPLVVVGFFTPDYTAAAASFAANLCEHAISHHLYHRSKIGGGWSSQTRQKPSVLTEARKDYPDSVLVLMDVDCRVRGDISGILRAPGDVALRIKRTTLGSTFSRRYALKPCSRVVLARPTPGSSAFVSAWKSLCDSRQNGGCDETLLMHSMSDSPDHYSVGTLSLRYAGLELRDASSDAIVVHDSIRDVGRPAWAVRKRIQAYFRTARDAAFQAATGKTYAERFSKRGRRPNLASEERSQR
jgi:hypothetical protein